jgi:hypothetical protein
MQIIFFNRRDKPKINYTNKNDYIKKPISSINAVPEYKKDIINIPNTSENVFDNNLSKHRSKSVLKNFLAQIKHEETIPIKQTNFDKPFIKNNKNLNLDNFEKRPKKAAEDFNDFKHELKSLQLNIEKIEKKLCNILTYNHIVDNGSISLQSPLSSLQNQTLQSRGFFSKENFFDREKNANESRMVKPTYQPKNSDILTYTKNILNKSSHKIDPAIIEDDKLAYFDKTTARKRRNCSMQYDNNFNSIYSNDKNNSQNSITSSFNEQKRINFLENEIRQRETILHTIKEELNQAHNSHEELNRVLKLEKEKNFEYENEIKLFKKSNQEANEIKERYYQLRRDYDNLTDEYKRSEEIRNEQNKIIKTLQNEIDILRDNYTKRASIPMKRNELLSEAELDTNHIENPFISDGKKIKVKKLKKKKKKKSASIKVKVQKVPLSSQSKERNRINVQNFKNNKRDVSPNLKKQK